MKKISININHFLTFSELSAEKVKKIILGLLAGDIEGINDAECRGIARIITNENITLSEIRKKSGSSRCSNKSNVQELSTQKSYPQGKLCEQTKQNEQNEQNSPLASPYSREIKKLNINISHSGAQGCGKNNCFNQHLEECARLPEKTVEEREQFVKAFSDIFDEINKFGYDKEPNNPDYDATEKIVRENKKQKYLDAMFEIIDTFIEMFKALESLRYIQCGKEKLFKEDIAQMAIRCNYDILARILYQLAYRPGEIKNHPYYILRSIRKNLKEKEEMS